MDHQAVHPVAASRYTSHQGQHPGHGHHLGWGPLKCTARLAVETPPLGSFDAECDVVESGDDTELWHNLDIVAEMGH